MDYVCYECHMPFSELSDTIKHLKVQHYIKENASILKCLVNYNNRNECKKGFHTFNALRKHVKSCLGLKKVSPETIEEVNFLFFIFWLFCNHTFSSC